MKLNTMHFCYPFDISLEVYKEWGELKTVALMNDDTCQEVHVDCSMVGL